MKKELSIRQLFIDFLGFTGNNFMLLCFLTVLSFVGSYGAVLLNAAHNNAVRILYFLYIYFFYYFFTSLYFNQKPLISKEKFVDSSIKLLTILALSLFILICGKLGFNLVRHLGRSLIVFPDFYAALRQFYLLILANPFSQIIIYLAVILLLVFSFLIPGFAWISTINGQDNSILTAYAKVKGHYLKIIAIFLILYGLLPLAISFIGSNAGIMLRAIFYALQTTFQIIIYLHIYERLYAK